MLALASALLALSTLAAEDPPLLPVGEVVEGTIEDGDPAVRTGTLDAGYTDAPTVGRTFRLEVAEPGPYTIELRSYAFDAYLVLRDAKGAALAEDDDGLVGTHSLLALDRLEAGTTYLLEACALHGERGPFELALRRGAPAERTPGEQEELEIDDARRYVAALEARGAPEDAALARALMELGRRLSRHGRLESAREVLERALAMYERVFGPDAVPTGTAHFELGTALRVLNELDPAQRHFERALAIYEVTQGPESLYLAPVLDGLADLFERRFELPKARELQERALAIVERELGPDDPEVAAAHASLGTILRRMGELDGAREHLERALAIVERLVGPEHPDTATVLSDLAVVARDSGDLEGERRMLERVYEVDVATLGPEHPYLANTLAQLASLEHRLGEYEAARPLLERAIAIRRAVFGEEHPQTLQALRTLGSLLKDTGEQEAARVLFERVVAGLERAHGPDHPRVAEALVDHGLLLLDLGEEEGAQRLLERALAIHEAASGPVSTSVATCLHDLAVLWMQRGDYEAARRLQERALAIDEATFADDHVDLAATRRSMGFVLFRLGELDAARSFAERALEVRERVLGPEHPLTAGCLALLAGVRMEQGDLEGALALHARAFALRERLLGPAHLDTAASRGNVTGLLLRLGRIDEAWELAGRDAEARRARTEALLASMSEAEGYRYLADQLWLLELRLALAERLGTGAARVAACEEVLAWKGRVGRMLVSNRRRLAAQATPEERALVADLQRCQRQLSQLALGSEAPGGSAREQRIQGLRDERNRLELALQRAAGAREGGAAVTWSELRAALPEGSAALDIFAHGAFASARSEDGRVVDPGGWGERRYTAWITRPDREQLAQVDLGPTDALEAPLRGHLEDVVLRRGVAPTGAPSGTHAAALRELLWSRVAPYLEGVETVFVSPDGALATVPFETIETEDGRFLIEDRAFVYVSDLASLARRGSAERPALDSLLAIGAVDFHERGAWSAEDGASLAATTPDPSRLRGSFGSAWAALPATGAEARAVVASHEASFGAAGRRALLLEGAPTEERLKREIGRYAVLHLATHGFFQPEGTPSMWAAAQGRRGEASALEEQTAALVGKHPGLLSGLVCAGASAPDSGDDAEDGYLTAEEVGWLDLTGVELVVLSACETGLGRAQSGEGLLGLRRAFRTAGAETVVSSLWSVEDDSTARLMRDFYANLWTKGMGRLEALRAAQLAMLARNRMEHGAARPSTWGAFVLSGEWR